MVALDHRDFLQRCENMTLYISDMDGTLLNPAGIVSEKSTKILTDLINQGIHFTVATARTPLSALPLLSEIPVKDPMILMNGALCYDPEKKAFSDPIVFEKVSLEKLVEAEDASGMEGMLFSVDQGILTVNLGDVKSCMWDGYFSMEKVAHVQAIRQDVISASAADLLQKGVVYGLYMDNEPTKLDILFEYLKGSGLTVDYYKDKYTENRWCIEICSRNATKGNALNRLKQQGYDYLIGFGDSWNDVPLFQACDEGYAVANASDELKQLATAVILSNAEDGVAAHILHHLKF